MDFGNIADWFSAIGTIFSSIVALYLGLRKDKLNISYFINYSVVLKRWTITVSNVALSPLLFSIKMKDRIRGVEKRTGCFIEARKPYTGVCPGGEIELIPDRENIVLNLELTENINNQKIRLQFRKKGNQETLFKVYFKILGYKLIYKTVNTQKIDVKGLEDFIKKTKQ